ncbi:2-oxoglutarate and iron-dependent oxygenase domain-containing protein 2 isoform X2 [Echinops telfairi]|uniref:2-oxoglutarate and iron-dependent oxygenase domain-containing protein 2 isoform X2 n=1 Tax=Echinops telfairi TaxID=9371 RepID=A0AC55DLZ9_ECHTE|nr:2-oxoglutarate and iron-dependent oxygenase domain-containing protein 2 isoform X2 [Echinops telfairi]
MNEWEHLLGAQHRAWHKVLIRATGLVNRGRVVLRPPTPNSVSSALFSSSLFFWGCMCVSWRLKVGGNLKSNPRIHGHSCSQVLRSRGCLSSDDFQQLLAELEQEVERRRRLGQESAARKALIASSYRPARPDVYAPLQDAVLAPEFRATAEYSASPNADLGGLLQKLETLSEEKRIYRLPVFTAAFCGALLEELGHFEQSDLPKGRPNTMNNHGVLLHELGLDEPLVTPLRERFLQPLMALLYPEYGGALLDSHRAFVVKYAPGQDRELACHYDNAELTLNVALGKAFTGGALYFGGFFQAPAVLTETLEVEHVVGQGILHRGGQLHGARPLGSGERWNLVVWLRASTVRNRLCPMCCRPPCLVDDEGFGDGFTREEPPTVDVCTLT